MKEADFDRAIDAAAVQLVRREPSSSITDGVMVRIQSRPRVTVLRPAWMAASVCAVLLFGAIGWVMMSWSPAEDVPLRTSVPAQVAPPAPPALPAEPVTPPAALLSGATVVHVATRVDLPAQRAPVVPETELASALEDLENEPLVVAAIELAPLETPAASVAQIQIVDITIEPLTASND